MASEIECEGYPIVPQDGLYWVGDQHHRDIDEARRFVNEELVGSGVDPSRVRALYRLHNAVERGDDELDYLGVVIEIRDDYRDWTYVVDGHETGSLEEAMDHAEDVARMTPGDRLDAGE